MCKLPILFLMFLIASSSVAQEVVNSETLVQYLHRDQQKLAYKVDVHEKSFFQDDTLKISYQVFAERNKEDTIYGYNFKIVKPHATIYNLNGTLYKFFDDNGDRKFLTEQKKDGKLDLLLIPNMNLNAGDLVDTLHTTVSKVDEGYIVHKHYDSINQIKNIDLTYKFSVADAQLISFTSSVYFQDSQQYRHLDFGSLAYDFDIDFEGEIEQFLKVSQPFVRIERTVIDQKVFPRIDGTLLNGDNKVVLDDFKSEILILDYWYFRCYPCIKAIPKLNNLNAKYPDSLVGVVGINIIDDKIKDRAYLDKFIKKNRVNYPSIFTKQNPLSVNSFPTVIIIDKDFNILYSEFGYSENMEEELTGVIEKYLSTHSTKKDN
ncbi:TlpA family protein disulfide reductase [Aequorivita sp. H23M31]|uniref:TlpA family protein disulfide reductase n=1 Tax=Aequorivita ciconiae TaxID=2494375 RepID=A0A410G543_9FLAO|nr:TlpA disulfide reductase family protein [Aequorivita sp. H23M31]QAA82351.1 TlpA family protein disulfide reductase [Aequorivita sp. H23M31]